MGRSPAGRAADGLAAGRRLKRLADGWTSGRTDGRKDGRTDGRKDGRTEGRTDGRTDGRVHERTKRVVVEQVGQAGGRQDGWMGTVPT